MTDKQRQTHEQTEKKINKNNPEHEGRKKKTSLLPHVIEGVTSYPSDNIPNRKSQ